MAFQWTQDYYKKMLAIAGALVVSGLIAAGVVKVIQPAPVTPTTAPAPTPATYAINWPDRRPVGMFFSEGRRAAELAAYWAASLEVATRPENNAQAVIWWDAGDDGYDGSPTEWTRISGMPVEVYKALFDQAKAKGLRVGCTIAGQGITSRDANGNRTYTTYTSDDAIVAGVVRQIAYARDTYGISIVYIDSNIHAGPRAVDLAQRVASAVPTVLCVFELYDGTSLPVMVRVGSVLYSFDHYEPGVVKSPQFASIRADRWAGVSVTNRAAWTPGITAELKAGGVPFFNVPSGSPQLADLMKLKETP